jgi:hypothetical protein
MSLLKLDEDCTLLDEETFGIDFVGYNMKQLDNGELIAVGREKKSNGSNRFDAFVMNLTDSGSQYNLSNYGDNNADRALSVESTADGGYIVVGDTGENIGANLDFLIFRIDENGNEVWRNEIDSSFVDMAHAVLEIGSDQFLVAGTSGVTLNDWNGKLMLMKIDIDGNVLWTKQLSITVDASDLKMIRTEDNGFLIVGGTNDTNNPQRDFFAWKLDEAGDEQWLRTYGGSSLEVAESVIQLASGDFVLVGSTYSFGNGLSDAYVIKIDKEGNEIWAKTYGGKNIDTAELIIEKSDGTFIVLGGSEQVSGSFNTIFYTLKLSSEGIPL